MNKLLLSMAVMLVAGTARAVVPEWLADASDASAIVRDAKANAAKMATPDAAMVPAPKELVRISAGEGGHLLELARRVIERGEVTLNGKDGDSDKYIAYACENESTHLIAAVARASTCAKVFPTDSVRVVALEVLADLHADGKRSIKGFKVYSGHVSRNHEALDMRFANGLWIRGGRVAEYTTAEQLTSGEQSQIRENLDAWERMTTGMMGLDDSCYDNHGGTCG